MSKNIMKDLIITSKDKFRFLDFIHGHHIVFSSALFRQIANNQEGTVRNGKWIVKWDETGAIYAPAKNAKGMFDIDSMLQSVKGDKGQ